MQNNNEYYVNIENSILDDETTKRRVEDYHGEFKAYRPKFKPRPDNYYPNSCKDRCIQFLMLIPTWILCGVLLYAFTKWGLANTRAFAFICIGVWCVYITVIVIAVFFGSRDRMKKEREYIEKKIEMQRNKKNIDRERNQRVQEKFATYADKERMKSVNVIFPSSKLGI